MSTLKENFSLQVFKEQKQSNDEISLLEAIEILRETHGLEATEVKKYLTDNLFAALELEQMNQHTVENKDIDSIDEWF